MPMAAEQILEALDEQQREAAMSLHGPTLILAGAGTGKTRTITHRIAYGIALGDYTENRILALTYTNRAAGELRSRLRALDAGSVNVKTFHAAALAQVDYFWQQFYSMSAPRVIESKSNLISKAAGALKLSLDAATVRELAAEIEWRKYNMLALEEYAELISNRPAIAGLSAAVALSVQHKYEDLKISAGQVDWEDVLILTLGMLRAEPRALNHVHQQYRFFTVDEYQDISKLQQELLDVWLGDHSEICAVGDPNQTIYTFAGASSEFLQSFDSRYVDANVIELTKNYRSTEPIILAANRIVSQNQNMAPLESVRGAGASLKIETFDSQEQESAAIAKSIAAALAAGTKASQIAVLYRINSQSEVLENALSDAGIEYQVRGGQRFFNRQDVSSAVRLVRAEAMTNPTRAAFESMSAVARSLGWQALAGDLQGSAREKWDALNALVEIADELGLDATVAQLATELDERARSQHEPQREAITLSTVHAAKGLEWQKVFIFAASEGYLPISYANTAEQLAEEQRLFYVAVTRAKDALSISWSKRENKDSQRERTASRFLQLLTPAS